MSLKLVGLEQRPERSVVQIGGVKIGPDHQVLIAGPCAVETPEQTLAAARMAKSAGALLLRGGALKPRTSPYAFQGLGRPGLEILREVGVETGLPTVSEVIEPADVDLVASHIDMLQIGTRNMQNFALLRAAGAAGLPVLLKRGMSATVEEWLLAAEYLAVSGAAGVVLCERGIRTFENATRNTLDISAVPVAKALSHLPVIVDPSHSGGRRDLVLPLARAAIAAGADGLIVDIHPVPGEALCDGGQALNDDELRDLMEIALVMPAFFGRPCRQVGAGQSLPELHHRLAMVDYHIMAAIGERRHIAQLIGALKHDPGRAVRDPGHEEQVLVEARALAQRFGVPAYTASRVYDCLIADSVQAQGGASEWS